MSTHVINAPRPSPLFAGLLHLCIIVNTNKGKNGGGLGTVNHFWQTAIAVILPHYKFFSLQASGSVNAGNVEWGCKVWTVDRCVDS